jgi:DNA-binding NarL/FixJ family response regulator
VDRDPVTVGLANDYELVVKGLAALLAPFDDLEIVELNVRGPLHQHVQVVLLDTYGEPMDSTFRLRELVNDPRAGRVAVFTFDTRPERVQRFLAAGASGVLSKALDGRGLVEALRRLATGEQVVIAPHGRIDGGNWPGRDLGLTERESEVLAFLAMGPSNRRLAELAGVSEHTVKSHLKRIFAKLGVSNRAQAVAFAAADPSFVRRPGADVSLHPPPPLSPSEEAPEPA